MKLPFSKYQGCGNDFILIDNRSLFFPVNNLQFIQHLCQRDKGIGADGVVLLENDSEADFRMRIFNADGNEAEMCGNGIRCLMKFIQELGFKQNKYKIATLLRPLTVEIDGDLVSVEMGVPLEMKWDIPLNIDGIPYIVHYINTGVPHVILFVQYLQNINLNQLGPKFRHHPLFGPKGANFNIAHVLPTGEIWNRTYERGVETETRACGTGCTAVAIAANKIKNLQPPIKVRTLSLDVLEINFKLVDGLPCDTVMKGPATKVFQGESYF